MSDKPLPARPGRGPTLRSLGVRNFRLFFGGQLISQVGNWLTMVAQTLLVLRLTHNGVAVGLLQAAQFLPVLLFGPWTGLVVDRSDKRRLLLIIQSFAMLQSGVLAALAFSHRPPLFAFYLAATAGGFATAFDNPARRSFVVEMVPIDQVQNAVSLNTAMMTGARVVGPALAGLLIHLVGFGWCFAIDALSYIAVLAGLAAMRTEELRPSVPAPRAKGQVRAGLRYARSVPDLFVPLAMTALIGALAYNFSTVLPLFATRVFHGSDTTYTWMFSAMSVGSVSGALLSARRRTIELRTVVLAAGAFGLAMFALAAAPNLSAAFALSVVVGFVSVTFMTSSTAIVQLRADPEMRGRVLALQAMVFLGSTPIGGPILGAVCEYAGARVGLVIGGLSCVVAAAAGWRQLPLTARSPSVSVPPA